MHFTTSYISLFPLLRFLLSCFRTASSPLMVGRSSRVLMEIHAVPSIPCPPLFEVTCPPLRHLVCLSYRVYITLRCLSSPSRPSSRRFSIHRHGHHHSALPAFYRVTNCEVCVAVSIRSLLSWTLFGSLFPSTRRFTSLLPSFHHHAALAVASRSSQAQCTFDFIAFGSLLLLAGSFSLSWVGHLCHDQTARVS